MKFLINVLREIFRTIIIGIIVGIIAGGIVSYLFSVPAISLNNTVVTLKGDKIDITFWFENKGKSSAVNLSSDCIYDITEYQGYGSHNFVLRPFYAIDRIEVGDAFSYTLYNLPIHLANKDARLFVTIRYNDSHKFRQFINEKLFRNKYKITKWLKHNRKEESLILMTADQKNKFEEALKRGLPFLF